MQAVIKAVKKIFAHRPLRKKLLFTLSVIFFYRALAHVPVPGVDVAQLGSIFAGNQFLSLLNVFSGGTLSRFSVMAVGINPYITASIIFQLAGMVIPSLKELQKDGESGREKVNQYTRLASVPLAIVQSISVLMLLRSQGLLSTQDPMTIVVMILTLVAGATVLMWLGELVSQFGVGNGISIVLFAGILSQLPTMFSQVWAVSSADQWMTILIFGVVFLLIIGLIVYMNEAVRKVTIEYAKRQRGSRLYGGQRSHLPIRVNVAGVLPIIFAISIMMAPSFISRILVSSSQPQLLNIGQKMAIWFTPTAWPYMVTYFVIVFAFTYFSALIFFNAEDISDELKKSGAFLPGIRPGVATKKYLEFVVTRITLAGAFFLGFVALMPSLVQLWTGVQSLAIGGTSVLIIVSVILETAKQVESQLVEENYNQYR
ncbi:MAG: preprotein translocase subunit SecY [Patescibacteria group bacterium]|nr:preprotein translocase subunit SecY [Patescibacteria group bacterium]